MEFWTVAAIWLVCGVIHYGATLAYFQREFPTLAEEEHETDRADAMWTSCFGPFGLLALLCFWLMNKKRPFKHGFMWW